MRSCSAVWGIVVSADLRGKRCLIVGASSGIGAAVARRFGDLGMDLVIHCNSNRDGADSVAAEVRAAGGKAEVLQADVSDGDAAAGLVD